MEALKTSLKNSSTSSNFWINLITFISVGFGAIILTDDNPFPFGEAVSVYEAILSKSILAIVVAAFTFGNSIRNIIKNFEFGNIKRLLSNTNVWTALATTVTAIFAFFNMEFPQDQALEVVDAIKSGNLEFIIIAGFNFLNVLWHMIKKPVPQAT